MATVSSNSLREFALIVEVTGRDGSPWQQESAEGLYGPADFKSMGGASFSELVTIDWCLWQANEQPITLAVGYDAKRLPLVHVFSNRPRTDADLGRGCRFYQDPRTGLFLETTTYDHELSRPANDAQIIYNRMTSGGQTQFDVMSADTGDRGLLVASLVTNVAVGVDTSAIQQEQLLAQS